MAKPPESQRKRRRGTSTATARRRRTTYARLEAFDRTFLDVGGERLAGIDEAGRGALAGPVVAAAVVLPRDSRLHGVMDSKEIGEDERESLFELIAGTALDIGIAMSHVGVIDSENILNATLYAMGRAARNLRQIGDVVLIDGRDRIELPTRVVSIVGGDHQSLSIAAASVMAKVARDRYMRRLHERYPEYNFCQNKGYGTKDHLQAIDRYGVIPQHRRSFLGKVVANNLSLF